MNPIVFEKSYINRAWGYQNHGVLITNDGHIWNYNLSNRDPAQKYSVYDKLKSAQLIGQIEPEDMDYLLDLLDCAMSEPPLPPKHSSAYDAGTTSITGYLNGQSIELDLQGDFSSISPYPCVQELVTLLNQYMMSSGVSLPNPPIYYDSDHNEIHIYL